MPATEWGWLITPDELASWMLQRTPDLLVLNKPPHAVVHPSRYGPWSSLIGACREYLGVGTLHMPFRLDRETSGVLLFGTNVETGRRLQNAVRRGRFHKRYIAVVEGQMTEPVNVDEAIGPDSDSEFIRRQRVRADGQSAQTRFEPVEQGEGYTLVKAFPTHGRRHQIRVHAASLGHPVAGDKLYGRDPSLMLEFLKNGFSERLLAGVPVRRHLLHAAEVTFETQLGDEVFTAPLADDLKQFWEEVRLYRPAYQS